MRQAAPRAGALALPRPTNRALQLLEKNWRLLAEILFIVPAYAAYQLVRSAVGGRAGDAFDNASLLIDVERRLGIFYEAALQQYVLPKAWIVDLANYYYIYGHLPVIVIVAIWLYLRHRENYALFRNAFMLSGLFALVGFSMVPLAPPRYMPEFGFVDTIVQAQSYYVLQNPKIVNQYAAMPSLHFGWDLLVVIAVGTCTSRRWLRYAVVILPLFTLSGIVLTANHYFLDAVGGAAVALAGLGIALLLRRGIRRESIFSFLT
jgi:hypothetical protein